MILSTNVAESSVTIEGVTAVIDSGLARVAADSPWTGLPSVEVRRISQASATQRAGRAGRTAPGRVIRLYSAEDFHRRPAADVPEILRRELSQLVLQLRAMNIEELEWLDRPPEAAFTAANALLDRLGVTPEMAELPLPPRLAKLVLAAKSKGVPEKGCAVAAVLSAGERGNSDLLALAESDWQPQTQRIFDQLRKKISGRDVRNAGDDARSCKAFLPRFPIVSRAIDVTANCSCPRAGRPGSRTAAGSSWSPWISRNAASMACRWFAWPRRSNRSGYWNAPSERVSLEWNRAAERVEQVTALVYDQLVIEETRAPAAPGEEASRLLAQKALEAGIGRFADRDAVEQVRSRAAFGGITIDVDAVLVAQCHGRTSFAELEEADLLKAIRPGHIQQAAPERLKLPGGREVKVHYEPGKPPWIESRLQDFFGMREYPAYRRRARGSASSRPESSAGASHLGSGRILGAAVSAGAQGTRAAVSRNTSGRRSRSKASRRSTLRRHFGNPTECAHAPHA